MLNFRKKKKEEEKKLVIYKNHPPAEVIDVDRRGKNFYLLLRWSNYNALPKWVKADMCKPYTPVGKRISFNPFGRTELNWFEKFIVKLQNWWYGRKN